MAIAISHQTREMPPSASEMPVMRWRIDIRDVIWKRYVCPSMKGDRGRLRYAIAGWSPGWRRNRVAGSGWPIRPRPRMESEIDAAAVLFPVSVPGRVESVAAVDFRRHGRLRHGGRRRLGERTLRRRRIVLAWFA